MIEPLAFDGLPPLRNVIETHGLAPKKNLGQNFILDLNLTAKIATLAGTVEDRLVIEIGPGPGGLTRALLGAGARRVIAVERDERCMPALAEVANHWPDRLAVLLGDALTINWQSIIIPELCSDDEKALIIANLPYGIATKLLIGWLETEPWPPWFDGMALMFQREVAERIVALPSTKPYGRLSVISQWRCNCNIALTLGSEAFQPPPKVASAVVQFTPRLPPDPVCDVRQLARASQIIFGQRRKMLRASLKSLFRYPEIILQRLNIDPTARAENLTITEIVNIAIALDALE